MKRKLTFNFIISIILIIAVVVIINIISLFGFLFLRAKYDFKFLGYNSTGHKYLDPQIYVRDFSENIQYENGSFFITNEGKLSLDSNNAWIQILDGNGKEVYNYKKVETNPTKYTPFQIIDYYKYSKPSTMFIGNVNIAGLEYSYLIGFPLELISKNVLIYNKDQLASSLAYILLIVLFVDIIIASLFGLYFSTKLIKPIDEIVEGISKLSEGKYHIDLKEKGIYKDVYANINNLALSLESNNRERKKIDTMKEEWISNISHDIKTPLSSIKGYSELLGSDYYITKEEIKEYAEIIENKSMYIKEVVEDLHLSTRLKNKDIKLKLEKVNLVKLIKEIIVDILNNPNNKNENIHFISSREIIENNIDIVLFKRAINNILLNAISHNNQDVKIDVIVEKIKNKTIIKIEDNGKGIAKKDMENIFNRYYRGTNTNQEGSGLGLAIANDIIKIHGGKIEMESQLQKGTIFTIILFNLH
ncbi:HAMP domain-containing histidine kinase [Tissierella sp. MSJ-40]|uniref:histidine kinase n=1 Tax=Tissierella simiarum TaxID=2841534 RepID=A0ABS6E9F2_9FIRM|nr:HAMP domain-containing sensor histidine kinase [Tissierella simiarum]MBU5439567.1 HAMP domain-containing histidine kinase [Tissierella simiarum]